MSSDMQVSNEKSNTNINEKKNIKKPELTKLSINNNINNNINNTNDVLNFEVDLNSETIYKSIPIQSNTYMGPPPLTKRLNIELENTPRTNIFD